MTAFGPANTTVLAYTAVSARAAFPVGPGPGAQLELQNDGAGTVWVAFGDVTVVAAIPASPNNGAGYPILPGQSKLISIGAATYVAAIGTGSGSLYATMGFGS